MNRNLSIAAMLGFTCSAALAQNYIDFHAQMESTATDINNDDPSLPDVTAHRHAVHLRIDTDAPPILDHPTLTRFDVEIISWDLWDSVLAEYGFINDTTPPFSSDGNPTLDQVELGDLSGVNAYLQVQDAFWTISLSGSLGIDEVMFDIAYFDFTVRSPYPEFAVGIDSLPDDPALYAPSDYSGSDPVSMTSGVLDYIARADWPPAPSGFGNTTGTLAWSAMLYTEPQPECAADLNGDGVLDFFDISAYINAFQSGCP
tara:strand:+ start:878 stop:1651 length:774 start_codon:yes stop_codon:yes gene_type:complete